uniref:Uncharacterized protein n=1 Tax=Physcomitrium patens TaxID=3218 RepID=A0A2K1K7R3_PHYPA|nr:hypothetical protein PHYPA_011708 [Physcomitrium patens]
MTVSNLDIDSRGLTTFPWPWSRPISRRCWRRASSACPLCWTMCKFAIGPFSAAHFSLRNSEMRNNVVGIL